jgi:hypothetical protein
MPDSFRPSPTLAKGLPLVVLSLAVLVGACSLFEEDQPERVRVQVEGATQEPVRIIVSREFLIFPVGEGGEQGVQVEIVSADTVIGAPPFDQSFDLAPTYRFLARAEGMDEENPVTLRLRVSVDGTERFNQSRAVPGDLLQFVYIFQ